VKRVFVDTGAFFAVLIPEDLHHERARALSATP
jgi:predicted nucleic acid-binding protein